VFSGYGSLSQFTRNKLNNRAVTVVARKPPDAAAVPSRIKFADNIHDKFKSCQASKAGLQSSKPEPLTALLQAYRCKTEFNANWPFKVMRFRSQWKGVASTKDRSFMPSDAHSISIVMSSVCPSLRLTVTFMYRG